LEKGRNMDPIHATPKQSGDKEWVKVTADTRQELERVASQVHEPIKDAEGRNPEHVDIPQRKADKIGNE